MIKNKGLIFWKSSNLHTRLQITSIWAGLQINNNYNGATKLTILSG